MQPPFHQLISYIAPAAPATRRPAEGPLPHLRPEIGFTPNWYRQHFDVDFGARWHTDAAYRRATLITMRAGLRERFPGTHIGSADSPDRPLDLLTGAFGACVVASIYGVPTVYSADGWPTAGRRYLTDDECDRIEPPDLDANPAFAELMAQVDWIAQSEGRIEGFVNWQGVLNNAHRLRGEQIFLDLHDAPERCRRLFECVLTTMIDATHRLHERQRKSGVDVRFFTVSNCLVNLLSPRQYRQHLLPFDQRLAEEFGCLGVHNCAWNASPYLTAYSEMPDIAYIDMGLTSDLCRARDLFPQARRALMYTPMDVANKSLPQIRADLTRVAREYGPCDVVCADIEAGTPDERVVEVVNLCAELSRTA